MADLNVNSIGDASGGTTTTVNGYTPTASNMAGRNRIINGGMVLDQRNAGASVTITTDNTFTLDRWSTAATAASKFSVQQSTTAATGFTNSLLATSLTAYSVAAGDIFALKHTIEGFNVSDLGFGVASASTVTVSFWVRSSLTGTFGGALQNGAQNRSYPFSFTINAANTFEYKTVTIAGDTSGTWLTNNGKGLLLWFSLGTGTTYSGTANAWASGLYFQPTGSTSVVGTSGATFYITGVQLEAGSVATPFETRQYGQELALCQRYYFEERKPIYGTFSVGRVFNSKTPQFGYKFPTPMRTLPSVANAGSGCGAWYSSGSFTQLLSPAYYQEDSSKENVSTVSLIFAINASLTDNTTITVSSWAANSGLSFSAEL